MHFEILVEDRSGSIALKSIIEKTIGPNGQNHTYKIHSYKGIGRLPKNLRSTTDPKKRILLDNLPRILVGYGKSLERFHSAVIVVVDLDTKDCKKFKQELLDILNRCNPAPQVLFRIAIEEFEAWLLGDKQAVKRAYPKAKDAILDTHKQDSICGTWEKLADAVFPGGSSALKSQGWPYIGLVKCEWAERISLHLDINRNKSKSFAIFRNGLKRLAAPSLLL